MSEISCPDCACLDVAWYKSELIEEPLEWWACIVCGADFVRVSVMQDQLKEKDAALLKLAAQLPIVQLGARASVYKAEIESPRDPKGATYHRRVDLLTYYRKNLEEVEKELLQAIRDFPSEQSARVTKADAFSKAMVFWKNVFALLEGSREALNTINATTKDGEA